MTLENRMFRQQQRDAGNPYKEESRSWIAWSRGYAAGQLALLAKKMKLELGPVPTFAEMRKNRPPSTRAKT